MIHLRKSAPFVLAALLVTSSAGAQERMTTITTQGEFDQFIQSYYKEPRPDLVESAMKVIDTTGLASDPDLSATLAMAFSCIFSRHEAQREAWKASMQSLQEPAKKLLTLSLQKTPAEILASVPASPTKNDMNWGCFFATGDVKYIDGVIDTLRYLGNKEDLNLSMTAASAEWSLSSLARADETVKAHLEKVRDKGPVELRPVVQKILAKASE